MSHYYFVIVGIYDNPLFEAEFTSQRGNDVKVSHTS